MEFPFFLHNYLDEMTEVENEKGPPQIAKGLFRGNSWNRTNDTSIFSAVLYQLSYVAVSPPRPLGCLGDRKGTKATQWCNK